MRPQTLRGKPICAFAENNERLSGHSETSTFFFVLFNQMQNDLIEAVMGVIQTDTRKDTSTKEASFVAVEVEETTNIT